MKLSVITLAAVGVSIASAALAQTSAGTKLNTAVGVTTKEEYVAQAVKRFEEMDANKDGKLTIEERRSFGEQMMKKVQERQGATPATAVTPAKPETKASH